MKFSFWFWIAFATIAAIESGYHLGRDDSKFWASMAEFWGCVLLASARYLFWRAGGR